MALTVLVVDDDEMIRDQVQRVLHPLNCRVQGAKNGEEALHLATSKPPDLFIVGFTTAVLGGWSFISKLREYSKLTDIPVVVLSPSTSLWDRFVMRRMMRVRVYLRKPFVPDELRKAVRRTLGIQ